jgi:hypothetical protein
MPEPFRLTDLGEMRARSLDGAPQQTRDTLLPEKIAHLSPVTHPIISNQVPQN